MNCLYLVLILATVISIINADVNVYKKDFDITGKAYYFTPSEEYKGQKIAVGENCTKVVVSVIDAAGQIYYPSSTEPLSKLQGTYDAQIIRYPGGKCTLPDTQKYNKEVIQTTPEDLQSYYHGKQAPLEVYSFATKNNSDGGLLGGLLKNKWILIGVGAGVLLLIALIIAIISCSKSKSDDDDYKRFSNIDKDMKNMNQPYMGLGNNDSKENLISNSPYNANNSISTPLMNNWNSSKTQDQDSFNLSNTDLLAPAAEPKRVTSISYEEQQNYSKMMEKSLRNDKPKSSIPEEYEKYKTYRIVRKFTPQRNDELVVEIGNMVKLIKSFEDGWTLCYNIDTKKEGYIPKNKLAPLDKPQTPQQALYSDGSSVNSAFSTKPLLHSNSGSSLNNSYNRGNRGPRPGHNRNNSGRSGGPRGSPSQKGGPNKYYRRPSNDNYSNSNYQRSPKQRYDM